jgi:hypothetical protein
LVADVKAFKKKTQKEASTLHSKVVELKLLKQRVLDSTTIASHHKGELVSNAEKAIDQMNAAEDSIMEAKTDEELMKLLSTHGLAITNAECECDFISARLTKGEEKKKAKKAKTEV